MKTTEKPVVRFEDAAEQVTVTGWACKICKLFCGNDQMAEHSARWCCATDLPCACGGRNTRKGYTCCEECRRKRNDEQWAKRERRPWDGKAMLYSDTHDKWFADDEEFLYFCDDEMGEEKDPRDVPMSKLAERFRVILGEEFKPREFDMASYLSDYLPENDRRDHGFEEIEKVVNDWIARGRPWSWTQSAYAWDGTVSG